VITTLARGIGGMATGREARTRHARGRRAQT